MGEHKSQSWSLIVHKFTEAFGPSRVTSNDRGMLLLFDLDNINELEQFNQIGLEFVSRKIILPAIPSKEGNNKKMGIFIPKTVGLADLASVITHMTVRTERKPSGEIHRPILPDEPEHVLEEATGVEWRHVIGSPYNLPVVEAQLPGEVEKPRRAIQEYAIGGILKRGSARVEVGNWLEHQEKVESTHGIRVRTMLPKEWADSRGARDVLSEEPKLVAAIRKTFSPSR